MMWLVPVLALQSQVVLTPRYRVGEEEPWRVSLAFGTEYGDLEVEMSLVRRVQRVEDTGDMEVECVFKVSRAVFNGQEITPSPLSPLLLRLTSQGLPLGQKAPPVAGSFNLIFLRYMHLLPGKEWRLGEGVSVFLKDPGNSRTEVRGDMVAESLEKNELKTVGHFDLAIDGFARPLRFVRTAWFDVSSGRLVRAEGVVSHLPSVPGGSAIQAIQYRYERAKSVKEGRL